MSLGNVPLLLAATDGKNFLKQGVVETIIRESPPLEMLPFKTLAGTAYEWTEEGTIGGADFRNVNEGYEPEYGQDNRLFTGVAILGREVHIDPFLQYQMANQTDERAKQWRKAAKATAMRFDYEFLHGTGSTATKGFKGLNAYIEEGLGQKLDNTGGAGAVVDLNKLDELHDLFRSTGNPDAIMCTRAVRRQITKAARESISGVALIDVGTDVFGKQVTMWNGLPIRTTGDVVDADRNVVPLLDFNEDAAGTGTGTATSLYMIKFGEEDVCGLMGAGGKFDVVDLGMSEISPLLKGRLEWYPGLVSHSKYSVARLTNITAS